MYQTINVSNFRDAFYRMGRKENFTYDGLGALFDYLEEADENSELDVISLCCEYSEYESAKAAAQEYGIEGDTDYEEGEEEDEDAAEAYFLECLQDKTTVIEFDGGIIIQNF